MWGEMEIGGDGVMLFGSENGEKNCRVKIVETRGVVMT